MFKFAEFMIGVAENDRDDGIANILAVESASTHINFLLHKKCEAVYFFQPYRFYEINDPTF